jgi:hypothetical protein
MMKKILFYQIYLIQNIFYKKLAHYVNIGGPLVNFPVKVAHSVKIHVLLTVQ